MKKISKYQGLILKTTEYKDNASLVTIITKEGLTNYIVRGTKSYTSKTKKFTNYLSFLSFNATDSEGLNTLTEGLVEDANLEIIDDEKKKACSFIIVEKVLAFSEQIEPKALFYEFLISILDKLKMTSYEEIIKQLFEIKLLYLLGIAPELKACIKCGKKYEDYEDEMILDVSLGGIVCKNCLSRLKENYLDSDLLKVFRYLYYIKFDKVDEAFLKLIDLIETSLIEPYEKINKVIDLTYNQYLDFNSKVKKVIKQIQ